MALERHYDMKESGVEWIGMIPKGWKVSVVKRHYSITLGKMLESTPKTPDVTLENYICASNIKWGGIDISVNRQMCFSANEKEVYLLKDGDLLVMEGGATAGTAAIYQGEFSPCYIQNSVNRCRSKNGNVTPFLYYWLYFVNHSGHIESVCNCATFKHLTKEKLGRLPMVQVPLPEQTAIVAYLDEKCTAIDSIIAEAKATIEEYKAWKASVIFEAVTKGLDPNAEMKDSGVDIIGTMPKHWSLVRQRFLCKTTTGDHDTQDADPDGQYPFYVRSPIVERSNTYTFDGEGILMAGDGVGAGKVFHYATGKIAIHQRVYCFYDFNKILPRFYFYYMLSLFSTEIDKGSAKSTVASVRLPMLKDFKICLPPQDEQEAIVAYLDNKCASIDAIIAEKETLIAELEAYKKSLIFETVTGKKRVC